jgi:AraC family transcriptional regulator, exoenzyme S synthesis regulatory protein ExsA
MAEQLHNQFVEIVFSCIEDKFYKDEIMLDHHSFARIITGEMKVIQADSTFILGPGSTFLYPRNQPATIIKYPKDGQRYQAVTMKLTPQRLKDFYTRNTFDTTLPRTDKIRNFDAHPLLESFFASLMPYFDMPHALPPNMAEVKLEEAITILRSIAPDIDGLLADFEEPGKINLAEFMEKNFPFNLPLEKFSYLSGRSLTTFKRDFKKIFNTTPQRWLTQKRLELAHYQLSEKQRKPVEVYLEAGFEDLSHFSFAFKKQFGYSPNSLHKRN